MVCTVLISAFPSRNRPKYGGRYCLGERKRFRICNIRPCPPDKPSFRQVQCSQFNPMPYKGKLYKWTPVPNNSECAQPAARLLPKPWQRALDRSLPWLGLAGAACKRFAFLSHQSCSVFMPYFELWLGLQD